MDTKLLKQKILDLAIRGKLVTQDPNDEPANILLEKIRKEKQELIKQGKIKKDKNESTIFVGDDKQHYEKFADGTIKNIENEIPFEIPDYWCWCRLKDVAAYKKGPFGSSITKSMFVPKAENTYKVYEQRNAIYKNTFMGDYYISEEKFQELKSFELFPDDIIVSCAGTIGESYIVPSNAPKGVINQALMKITLFEQKMQQFYLYYFDRILKEQSKEDGKGSAMKNIPPFDILKKYLIPIPSLCEQQRIVEKIEELFAQVDKIEEEKQSLLKLIDMAKNKVLDLAMKGKLVKQDPNDEPASVLLEKIFEEKKKLAKEGKIKLSKDKLLEPKISDDNDYYQDLPKSWSYCTLGSISSIISKGTTPRNKNSYCNSGVGFLRIENINENFTISKKDMKYITQEVNDFELKRSILQDEDIIISIAGTLGKMAIIKKSDLPLNTNQAISFIRLINPKLVNTMFIIYYLQSPVVKSKLLSKAKVTAIPNLTLELLSYTFINLPPMLEQKRIVDRIENLLNKIEQIKDSL